jgi:L-ascorbate metabolism protein UlaG (beta-lactamase superfamily)
MKAEFLQNGISLRWLNTAGFEIVMSNGRHILLDPFISGDMGGLSCWPISIDKISACDYLLLSHIHFDHAGDVEKIQEKFPKLNLFVPDLSADPLCQAQHIDCSRLYRTRSGQKYIFDDLEIECFAGRHTEAARGSYRIGRGNVDQDGNLNQMMWFGSLELVNYLLTTNDGTKILVWAGMTSTDQKHQFAGIRPDISLMHVSPKQDFSEFAELTAATGTKIIIPHHYDATEKLFEVMPDMLNDSSEENRRKFAPDGKFSFTLYLEALDKACREKNPAAKLLMLEHHKWYRFGFAFACSAE